MTQLSLQVPADWQFGELTLADGRPGALRRTVTEAVRKEIFAPEGAGELVVAVERFKAGLAGLPDKPRNAAVLAVLQALGLRGPADGDAQAVPGQDNFCEFESALGLALHGICLSLAAAGIDATGESVADEAAAQELRDAADDEAELDAEAQEDQWDEETPDDSWAFAPDGGGPRPFGVSRFAAEGAIAHLLPKWRVKAAGEPVPLDREACALIARVLLKCAVGALPEGKLRLGQPRTVQVEVKGKARNRSEQTLEICDPAFAGRLAGLLQRLPFRFTMQPLKQPPAYGPSAAATESGVDSFDLRLIGYRRVNDTLKRFRAEADRAALDNPDFRRYVQAVDAQQAVGWCINQRILAVACQLAALAGDPESIGHAAAVEASQAAGLDPAGINTLVAWVRREFYTPRRDWNGARKAFKRPGDLLDHPLARSALADLAAVEADGTQPVFHLPWKADYRGRIYAETPWLTPQGGDLQRALFEFANGKPLDAAGLAALKRHGGNLASRSRVLADLDIKNRPVLTLREREAWVEKHEDSICRSAACPLAEPFWREVSGDPMQFLAFCMAYAECKANPAALIHLPVQIDGTCNGLQHIAAIMRSEPLARAVNVVGDAEGLPGDIYSELAEHARNQLGALATGSKSPGIVEAEKWLALHPDRCDQLLGRNAAKTVVMTVPYGAGARTQAQQMLKAHLIDCFDKSPLTEQELEAAESLRQWVASEPKRAGNTVHQFTKGHKGTWLDLERKAAAVGDAAAQQRHETTVALLTYVSQALVQHLRRALAEKYPEVGRFTRWLHQVADGCSGVPLAWPTPLGFPVCQDAFNDEKRVPLAVKLGKESVSFGRVQLGEDVDTSRQRSSLLPNLVHSLDSTHLAMSIWRAAVDPAGPKLVDFGSIHDCLLCHPNDVAAFAHALRSSFAELYAHASEAGKPPGVITQWSSWMQLTGVLSAAPVPTGLRKLIDGGGHSQFPLYIQALREEGPAWQAVCGEIRGLVKALRQPGDQSREQVISSWLSHTLPHASGDNLFQVWCDAVPRLASDEPAAFRIEPNALAQSAAFFDNAAAGAGFDADAASAAQREIAGCMHRLADAYKQHKGHHEVYLRIQGLAELHPEAKMPKAAREAAANPDVEMPNLEAMMPEEAGVAPAPWVLDCLRLETVLLRLETKVKRKHLQRLRILRALDAAVSVLRLRDAPASRGGDSLMACMARLALEFAVGRGDLGPVAADWQWKDLEAEGFDVNGVKDSIYFFN